MDKQEKGASHLDAMRRTILAYANDYEWDVIHDEPRRVVIQKRNMKLAFDVDGTVYGFDAKTEEFAFRAEYADEIAIKDLLVVPAEKFAPQG